MATTTQSGSPALSARLERREIALWLVVATLANEALHALDLNSPSALLLGLLSQNLIYWFACIATISLLIRAPTGPKADWLDNTVAGAIGFALVVSALVGYRFGMGIIATALAGYLMLARNGPSFRAAGTIMLALCTHLVWAPILFQYFLPWILKLDSAAVGVLLSLVHPQTIVDGSSIYGDNGHSVALVGGCSSLKNVSIALLAYVSAVMYVRARFVPKDIWYLGLTCLSMIVINIGRLAMLGMDRAKYDYWHDGAGAPMLALAETIVVVAVSVAGAHAIRTPA